MAIRERAVAGGLTLRVESAPTYRGGKRSVKYFVGLPWQWADAPTGAAFPKTAIDAAVVQIVGWQYVIVEEVK